MSLVLRHRPEQIGLVLDEEGWADVEELVTKLNLSGAGIDRAFIEMVVRTNDKKRFAFNEDGTRIRASQGHSVGIDLALQPASPPPVLYHGTAEKNREAILTNGISKMERQHVHLSKDKATAMNVGSRHGRPIVFIVHAAAMATAGHVFYLSANEVWLTDFVDPQFITL